jgi:hypothetical protein
LKISKLQAILSILIVGVFLIVTAIIALTPVLGGYPPEPFTEHLKTFSSLYSGIIGLIIGYFFGKQKEDEDK